MFGKTSDWFTHAISERLRRFHIANEPEAGLPPRRMRQNPASPSSNDEFTRFYLHLINLPNHRAIRNSGRRSQCGALAGETSAGRQDGSESASSPTAGGDHQPRRSDETNSTMIRYHATVSEQAAREDWRSFSSISGERCVDMKSQIFLRALQTKRQNARPCAGQHFSVVIQH